MILLLLLSWSLLQEFWFPGLKVNSQITRTGFGEKGNIAHYSPDEEEDRESPTSQTCVISLMRENVCFLKGDSGAQLEYVMKCMSQNKCWPWFPECPGTTSLKLYVLAGKFTPLVARGR
jgi:hypothetical protein